MSEARLLLLKRLWISSRDGNRVASQREIVLDPLRER